MTTSLRVMVVDDTITYRMIVKSVAESITGIQVVASANNGRVALERLPLDQPDVILLDVEMPVLDGLETLKFLHKNHPDVTVIMVSGLSRSNANLIMACLQEGALDFVTKPLESNATRAREALRRDLEPILTLLLQKKGHAPKAAAPPAPVMPTPAAQGSNGGAPNPAGGAATPRELRPALRRTPPPELHPKHPSGAGPHVEPSAATPPPPAARPQPPQPAPQPARRVATQHGAAPMRPGLLLIGSSTGGPAALTRVFSGIGQALPIPTLIVQHMPPVFTASLATQLQKSSGMDVQEAREGLPVNPGSVTLAAGGVHMVVKEGAQGLTLALHDGPKVNECRPAVDVLFQSVAEHFSGPVLAVILTGMGRDGAQGVELLKRNHQAWCIAQDQESCVVYGMPRAVVELGLADELLPLDRIGPRILELCR
ncbi:MAG: chemotaxis-specific protein-glutamate methyltransferase CheB [Magnetococcales bacterium]|nr:chemotaxis-specific protein-glutamate methyltransferase CheB [Magnetococcales bacterium]